MGANNQTEYYTNGACSSSLAEETEGLITYLRSPLESTGRPGWIWWARPRGTLGGNMGATETYEEARACVEAEIRRPR